MSTISKLSNQKLEKRLLIQQLNDTTRTICNELRKTGGKVKESCFSAMNTKKVHPTALIKRLNEFNNQCGSTKLKDKIRGIIGDINGLHNYGHTRMYVYCDKEDDGSQLEFVCCVVYNYQIDQEGECGCLACKSCKEPLGCDSCRYCKACKQAENCNDCEGCKAGRTCELPITCGRCGTCKRCRSPRSCGRCEECKKCEGSLACDYLLSTYSYKEKINRAGLGVGIGVAAGGVIAGGVALAACIASGGVGFIIAGAIAAAAGAGAGVGSFIIYKSTDTTMKADFEDVLKASFIYELMGRAFVEVEDGKLYLKLDN